MGGGIPVQINEMRSWRQRVKINTPINNNVIIIIIITITIIIITILLNPVPCSA